MLSGQSLNKNWRVVVTNTAKRQLRRIPKGDAACIEKIIDMMAMDVFGGDIAKIGGEENRWRRRVGNYRVMYDLLVDGSTIFIYDVRRRTSSTY